jgi:hypothetical protein
MRDQYGSDAQFLLFVDQLAEVRDLLLSENVTKHRMALVAIDNLAEIVLHRHKRHIQKLAEETRRHRIPRVSQSDEVELNASFEARVRLGRQGGEDTLIERLLRPLLDELDDALFRTGHAYRNRVYHADHHNATVLPLVARSYAGAVGRAFVRLQPTQTAHTISNGMRQSLVRYGYTGSHESWAGDYFPPAEAAEQIVTHLTADLQLTLPTAKAALREDIAWRTDWADSMISDLLGEPGMSPERFTWGLRWGEFWSTHGTDDQVITADREVADIQHLLVGMSDDDDKEKRERLYARIGELENVRNRRVQAMLREFVPKFDLGRIAQIRRLGERLSTARNVGTLIIRYQKLDGEMQIIEEFLDDMSIGWDRHVQDEEERARGN